MVNRPELSDVEWDLVVELLERERGELPTEIRHTRTRTVRDDLHARQRMVQDLLHRLKEPIPA